MLLQEAHSERRTLPWIRWAALLVFGVLCWLSRISVPRASTALELDPTYLQVLGRALHESLRFGREIVFTSGPLAYFPTTSPYDAHLYTAKLWLWDGLFGACVAALLFLRLARRGSWLDIAVGVLILIVLPMPDDGWLFAIGLLACDLGLWSMRRAKEAHGRGLRATSLTLALTMLSLLTLVKVTSLTFAFACLGILCLFAAANGGPRAMLRTLAAFTLVQCLTWVLIGQKIQDLLPYFTRSIELASGFDSAMSQPPRALALVLCIVCLPMGLSLCAVIASDAARATGRWCFDAPRAQALLVTLALLLSYKAGFARASDHNMTFFCTAMLAPLFLLPFEPGLDRLLDWNNSRMRCGVAIFTAVCAMATLRVNPPSPSQIADGFENRIRRSVTWLMHPDAKRQALEVARYRRSLQNALPRTKAIVGSRSISAFAEGDGVVFLNDLNWKPRPVFQAFSVLTQRTARENAEFLASNVGPDFILWRTGFIDMRLPSSEDPLSVQVLLRDYQVRANEKEFLLLERATARTSGPRTKLAGGDAAWGERLALPVGAEPAVLTAHIRPSLFGRARAVLYQTPEVFVKIEFDTGLTGICRIAPFALEAGVVLRPWLPTKEDWIRFSRNEAIGSIVGLQFQTAVESAFAPRIEYEIQSANDLCPRSMDPQLGLELALGALDEMPLRYDSPVGPELACWGEEPVMLLARAPARMSFSAGPGKVRLIAQMTVPPWVVGAPGFLGTDVLVYAHENGADRECGRFEVRKGAAGEAPASLMLNQEVEFQQAGELILCLRIAPGGNPDTARVGICNLRIER